MATEWEMGPTDIESNQCKIRSCKKIKYRLRLQVR